MKSLKRPNIVILVQCLMAASLAFAYSCEPVTAAQTTTRLSAACVLAIRGDIREAATIAAIRKCDPADADALIAQRVRAAMNFPSGMRVMSADIRPQAASPSGFFLKRNSQGTYSLVTAPSPAMHAQAFTGVQASEQPVSSDVAAALMQYSNQAVTATNTANATVMTSTAAQNAVNDQPNNQRWCAYRQNSLSAAAGVAALARSVFLRDAGAILNLVMPLPYSECQQARVPTSPVLTISNPTPTVGDTNVLLAVSETNAPKAKFTVFSSNAKILSVTEAQNNTWALTPLAAGAATIVVRDDAGNTSMAIVTVKDKNAP